jgi:hypothetical protein
MKKLQKFSHQASISKSLGRFAFLIRVRLHLESIDKLQNIRGNEPLCFPKLHEAQSRSFAATCGRPVSERSLFYSKRGRNLARTQENSFKREVAELVRGWQELDDPRP